MVVDGLLKRERITDIAVECIAIPTRQPRRSFDEAALDALAESIRQHGGSAHRRPKSGPGQYELIAGERRLRAARRCGLKQIPAIIRRYSLVEAAEIALIENLQREDLDAIEGLAYDRLTD